MNEKILRETRYPILEFVFRYTEKRVWLSLESVREDAVFMDIVSLCVRTVEFNNICDEICEKINSIYNIKANKQKLINMIRLFDKEDKKLSILTLSIVNRSAFNRKESSFKEYYYPQFSLGRNLEFMQDNMQYSKMHQFFIASDELSEKIFKLIFAVHQLTFEHDYDIFSNFESESLL